MLALNICNGWHSRKAAHGSKSKLRLKTINNQWSYPFRTLLLNRVTCNNTFEDGSYRLHPSNDVWVWVFASHWTQLTSIAGRGWRQLAHVIQGNWQWVLVWGIWSLAALTPKCLALVRLHWSLKSSPYLANLCSRPPKRREILREVAWNSCRGLVRWVGAVKFQFQPLCARCSVFFAVFMNSEHFFFKERRWFRPPTVTNPPWQPQFHSMWAKTSKSVATRPQNSLCSLNFIFFACLRPVFPWSVENDTVSLEKNQNFWMTAEKVSVSLGGGLGAGLGGVTVSLGKSRWVSASQVFLHGCLLFPPFLAIWGGTKQKSAESADFGIFLLKDDQNLGIWLFFVRIWLVPTFFFAGPMCLRCFRCLLYAFGQFRVKSTPKLSFEIFSCFGQWGNYKCRRCPAFLILFSFKMWDFEKKKTFFVVSNFLLVWMVFSGLTFYIYIYIYKNICIYFLTY